MIQREKLRLQTSSKHKETAINHRRMHKKYIENLKSELKDYSVEPFVNSSTVVQEIDFFVL